ncbi:hypothetical protein CspHIS471_0100340 [Cutaneotrichosporon sp. HIS471]|nr:hypothetical protein CspHIS471_0100340 [Cutaneotrichosporon sp. HIS471]
MSFSYDAKDEKGIGTPIHEEVQPARAVEYELGHTGQGKATIRTMKPRHIQLIGIGGAIGTGLFVGTGTSLSNAGPLSLVLGYAIYGALVLATFNAMGEMTSYLPVDGSILVFASRFVDPSYGFAMAWLCFWNNSITVAAEATAVASIIKFWNEDVNSGVWCAIFVVSILMINMWGSRYFGEAEFWFSTFKVILVFIIMAFTFVTMLGGNPHKDRYGFRYWKNPGAMREYLVPGNLGRFLGFWSVFIQAAFAYGGPDMIAMTAGEARYPRRVLPNVFNRVIFRLLFFYIGGTFCIGTLVPYTDPNLTGNGGKGTPPIVIGADRLNVPVLPHIINAIILTSAWSAGCCLTFTASRNLYAAAINGHAPRLFLKSFRGVPINSIIAVVVVSCLSFMTVSDKAISVFTWITNILGGMWILNLWLQNVLYLRFRAGCDAQGIDRSTFPYKRRGQRLMSWICVFAYGIIFLTNGFKVFMKGRWNIADFLFGYLVLGLFIALFLIHKTWSVLKNGGKWRWLHGDEMDFTAGKKEIDEDEKTYPVVGNSRGARFERWLWG